VEDVGAAQDGQRRQVAAEAPTPDGDPIEIEPRVGRGRRQQALDLVVEHRPGQIEVHAAFPRRASPGRAPAVDHDDGEPLVGEPL